MAIERNKIRTGDILLWKVHGRSSLLAKLIGFISVLIGGQGSYHRMYAHAAICEDQDNYLEMTWPRSKRSKIKYDDDIELWRVLGSEGKYKTGKTKAQYAVEYAQKHLGEHYNLRHLLTLGILSGYGCSDFVAKSYLSVDLVISIEGRTDKVVSVNEVSDSKITRKICG